MFVGDHLFKITWGDNGKIVHPIFRLNRWQLCTTTKGITTDDESLFYIPEI